MGLGFLEDIVKGEHIEFRGIPLGASLEEVQGKEQDFDDFYQKNSGHMSHLEYLFEVGDAEEITLYYGFDEEKIAAGIDRIDLYLKAYPKVSWKKEKGAVGTAFYQSVEQNKIGAYARPFLETQQALIHFYNDLLGSPRINNKEALFPKDYQNFMRYTWDKGTLGLSLTSYLDDLDNSEYCQVFYLLKLSLYKQSKI